MVNKKFVTWNEYDLYIDMIMDWVKLNPSVNIGAVYGLPRGGLPIAVSLSHKLGVPLLMTYDDRKVVTDKQILVVDDIADTGKTLSTYKDGEKNIICTLHYHKQSIVKPNFYCDDKNDDWIVYPWEREDSETVQDYLKS